MKLKLGLLTGTAMVSLALPGSAAERYPAAASDQRSRLSNAERITAPAKATEITGKEINNLQNEKLGKIDELGIDLESGRVALVVINSGGVLGVGAKSIAVPPQSLSYDPATKAFRLDVDKAKFKAAPAFEMSKWDEGAQTNQLLETYRYYGQQPYFAETRAGRTTAPGFGRVEKSSKLIGLAVVNKEDKKCGDVDNLIVDLPAGRLVHVIVSSGGFLGIGDALNAVPPSAFRYNAQRDSLIVDLNKEQLTRAPYFKSSDWPDFRDPAYSAKVYRSYGVEPYFSTDADNTVRNVRDRRQDSITPPDQGTSEEDVRITRRIRQEILAKDGLSLNARNAKVITANGRVTLRGPVKDEAERQAIAEIANRIAGGATVDNQLEVKREPVDKE